MRYAALHLNFRGPVHFGQGRLSDAALTCRADTLFSALCQEAAKAGSLAPLMESMERRALYLSDLFPFRNRERFIPRPLMRIESAKTADPALRKRFKKLTHIPVSALDTYLHGKFDPEDPGLAPFSVTTYRLCNAMQGRLSLQDTVGYHVGTVHFQEGCGLFFYMAYREEQDLSLLLSLMESLSFSGLGGRRSSGMGGFDLEMKTPDAAEQKLLCLAGDDGSAGGNGSRYLLLSSALPLDEELDSALEDAAYLMDERTGFVSGDGPLPLKKRPLCTFRAGSCFAAPFTGQIADVAPEGLPHPVYRYARALFMELRV